MAKSLNYIYQYEQYPSQAPADCCLQLTWNKPLTIDLQVHSEHRSLTLFSPLKLCSQAATLHEISPPVTVGVNFISIEILISFTSSLCAFRHILITAAIAMPVRFQRMFPSIMSPPRQKAPCLYHLFLKKREFF